MALLNAILVLILAYVIGSFSPGFFLSWFVKRIDIRKKGKYRNTGASNVYNVLGFEAALITIFIDLLKGVAAMLIAVNMNLGEPIVYLAGLSAVIGHNWPFYLNFKGGMGVATSLGIIGLSLYYYHTLFSFIFSALLVVYILSVSPRTRKRIFNIFKVKTKAQTKKK